jgi:lambda repressor-like predicted transcriptional regulator
MTLKIEGIPRTELNMRILKVLKKHRDRGIWLRKLAREAKVSVSTASRYVYDQFRPYIQIVETADVPQKKVVMVKLIKEPKIIG